MPHYPIAGQARLHCSANLKYFYNILDKKVFGSFLEWINWSHFGLSLFINYNSLGLKEWRTYCAIGFDLVDNSIADP